MEEKPIKERLRGNSKSVPSKGSEEGSHVEPKTLENQEKSSTTGIVIPSVPSKGSEEGSHVEPKTLENQEKSSTTGILHGEVIPSVPSKGSEEGSHVEHKPLETQEESSNTDMHGEGTRLKGNDKAILLSVKGSQEENHEFPKNEDIQDEHSGAPQGSEEGSHFKPKTLDTQEKMSTNTDLHCEETRLRGNDKTIPSSLEDIQDERSGGRHSVSLFLYVTLATSVVVLGVFVSYYFLDKSTTDTKFDYPKIFENRTKEMQKLFPNQTKRFWRILKSHSLTHLRNKNPDQPLVILLGAPPSAHAVVDCLAKTLTWCLDPNVSPSNYIDGSKYSKKDGDNTKKILDDKLTDIFEKGARATLIMHLEKLPPTSPLLFYKYCDNDEAPYKHAGIIFTVYLPHEPSGSQSEVEAEGSIEKFLSNVAWSQYSYDRDSVLGLLSRVADTVALVSHESDVVVQTVCDDVQK